MLKIMTANISNKLRNSPFRIVILGGGVSGIAAAQSLLSSCKRDKLSVTLLEGSSRFGGWVNSKTYPDGCVFELGPRTLRPAGIPGKQTLQLVIIFYAIDILSTPLCCATKNKSTSL